MNCFWLWDNLLSICIMFVVRFTRTFSLFQWLISLTSKEVQGLRFYFCSYGHASCMLGLCTSNFWKGKQNTFLVWNLRGVVYFWFEAKEWSLKVGCIAGWTWWGILWTLQKWITGEVAGKSCISHIWNQSVLGSNCW